MMKLYNSLDKPLIWSSFFLFVIGLLMIISSSTSTQLLRYDAEGIIGIYKFGIQQFGFIIVATIFSYIFILRKPIRKHLRWTGVLIWGVVITLALVKFWGTTTNNAQSWIPLIGGFRLQPSEFAKPIIILYLANLFNNFDREETNWRVLLWKLSPVIFTIILVMAQPDFGTALILALISGLIFLISPISPKLKSSTLTAAAGGIILVAMAAFIMNPSFFQGEKIRRLTTYQNPCADYYNEGLQVCNSLIAINSSKGIGKGLGNSTQKSLYLPESHTDFIMAITVEELGLTGFFTVIFLYFVVLFRLFVIAKRSKNTGNAIIAYGVAMYIFIHIFINLGGISATIPLTGVPLPFLSYGGSYTVGLVMSLALALRVSHDNKVST